MRLLDPLLHEVPVQGEQMTKKQPFTLVRVVARGGVEPPTFRFGVEPTGQHRTLLDSAR